MMRKIINLNQDWSFFYSKDNSTSKVNLPHTWNGLDGQDGGNDYYRGCCAYTKTLGDIHLKEDEVAYIEFKGVNSEAKVYFNREYLGEHKGGYSTFRFELTKFINNVNELKVEVSNAPRNDVYPQKADFTFYGGIYRDVNLIILNKDHFDLDYFGGSGIKVTPTIENGKAYLEAIGFAPKDCQVSFSLFDKENKLVKEIKNKKKVEIENVHLWNGLKDPYLYKIVANLSKNNVIVDQIEKNIGFRSYHIDPKKGFYLNGNLYPLRGVSRHQDRPIKGNCLSKENHEEDINLIKEVGANTIRLAHYQHDDYFYDLCDKYGFVVWAEIPYISEHLAKGDENANSQMKELIVQQYHHPSICFWGISNEITMKKTNNKMMMAEHKNLEKLVHELDPNRLSTLACFAMAGPNNKTAFISDVVAWNLYLGWYTPFMFLNHLWISFFHFLHPNRALGYSEYGAEAMTNLHSKNEGKRFDNSEEYQAKYHDYMIKCFSHHYYLWGTYVWNMFDFAADGRNQGGEPGMNHKGLVTFDRKIKKDAFYAYKCAWSKEKVFHLCGKRYINRHERKTLVKVYNNTSNFVEVYLNNKLIKTIHGSNIFKCKIKLKDGVNHLLVKSNDLVETLDINKVKQKDKSYVVTSGNSMSWEK